MPQFMLFVMNFPPRMLQVVLIIKHKVLRVVNEDAALIVAEDAQHGELCHY